MQPGYIDPKLRAALNRELVHRKLDGNGRFKKVGEALSVIGEVLGKNGLEWDDTLNAHLFSSDEGRRTLQIAFSTPGDPFSPVSIKNAMVSFSWYKKGDDNFEVVAYVS